MQRWTNVIVLLIVTFFFVDGFAQKSIEVSQLPWSYEINDHCLLLPMPASQSIDIQQIWSAFTDGKFLPEASIQDFNKLSIGKYYFCYFCCTSNDSDDPVSLCLRSKHTPVTVFKKHGNQFISVPFTGHSAQYDPTGVLSIKSRNTVSFVTPPHQIDSIFYITQIIEAGESKKLLLYHTDLYALKTLTANQWVTIFNGLFLGVLLVFLFITLYFYCRIKETFLIWYLIYLLIFLFYYWRNLELWNEQLDFSHQYLSWYATKGPITYLIFLFYLLFFNSILKIDTFSFINKFLKITIWLTPILIFIDILLNRYDPYWSIVFTYSFGVLMGCIQFSLLVPIWKTSIHDSTLYLLTLGSVCLFIGWLTILFFDVSIHQYTVRLFTLLEFIFFSLAIIEKFLKVKEDLNNSVHLRAQALSNERDRISAELHDDIGSTMSGISLYSYLASQQLNSANLSATQNTLQIIQNNAVEVIQKLSEIIWLTSSQKNSFLKLNKQLHEYASRMTNSKGIALITTFDNTILDTDIPEGWKNNIYLICKEAINNSIKYSSSKQLIVEIAKHKDEIWIEIADTGEGFEESKAQNGNGLQNMKKRAESIGAIFNIESHLSKGTKVQLKLPPY